jgi:hypothetical protein
VDRYCEPAAHDALGLRQIAAALNGRGIATARGGRWEGNECERSETGRAEAES